jgi:hypothetical protein
VDEHRGDDEEAERLGHVYPGVHPHVYEKRRISINRTRREHENSPRGVEPANTDENPP